jgi:hypothetical protein
MALAANAAKAVKNRRSVRRSNASTLVGAPIPLPRCFDLPGRERGAALTRASGLPLASQHASRSVPMATTVRPWAEPDTFDHVRTIKI